MVLLLKSGVVVVGVGEWGCVFCRFGFLLLCFGFFGLLAFELWGCWVGFVGGGLGSRLVLFWRFSVVVRGLSWC